MAKSTGIVRAIDSAGRVVIPAEIREYLDMNTGDDVSFAVENNKLIIERYKKAPLNDLIGQVLVKKDLTSEDKLKEIKELI